MNTTIDGAGRVVIPKALRDQMGLTAGSELEILFNNGRLELASVSKVRLERRGSRLVAVVPEGTPAMAAGTVESVVTGLREGRIR